MPKPLPSFETFFKQFRETLPVNLSSINDDLNKNMRTSMQSSFQRMNLVTREEFDVQAGVLARTRQKLEALEKRVACLEASATLPEK